MREGLSARERLLIDLDRSAAVRARTVEDLRFAERRAAVRAWQAARLAGTHDDLLRSPRFHDAAVFFLTDLYGPTDISRHIEDVRRIAPTIARMLPEAGVEAVAHAVELNATSEDLDAAMAEALGARAAKITAASYGAAYRKIDRVEQRKRQIDLIALLGHSLDALTRQRFISMALRMMRGPAHLAGLSELHGFLERGYRAFGSMRGGAGDFVATIVARERAISEALLLGDDGALSRPPVA